ncbi:MAG: type VI secretion system-associated FHA domain protein, partial [Verrucomicrobiota bacterium]
MVPAARKARLWELFNSLYGEVAREAEDDFQRLFGQAFVAA